MKKCQRTFCMKVTWTDFSLIFKNVKVKRQEASCCFRNRLWLSLVHICRNARGTLVYVHLVLHDMLLFCFIQEADLWPKPTFFTFLFAYCFDIFITWNFKQAYYKSFLSHIAHAFFSAFLFCMSFKTIHESLKILQKSTEFSNILPEYYWVWSSFIKFLPKYYWVFGHQTENSFSLVRSTRI